MKTKLLIFFIAMVSLGVKAQSTQTIALQFYVDANNNCVYDALEQIVYNVPGNISYVNSTGTVLNTSFSFTGNACGATTVYVWSPSVTPTNTLSLLPGTGIQANLGCGNYNNIAYNTNTVYYLPVTLTGTSSVGATLYYMNFPNGNGPSGQSAPGNTIGICSNIGTDSLAMYINVFNFLNCGITTSISPRTYSLFLDGVNFDVLTTSGDFGNFSTVQGVNGMSSLTEYYVGNQVSLNLYVELPSTFSVVGSHTFEIKSSMLYNDPLSQLDFSRIFNSIPCNKISGRFYNDCNSNCTFDGSDTYGVGGYATGLVYNTSTGYSSNFSPNPYDGRFSLYLPAGSGYSLTQYPTYPSSAPYNFTACSTSTIAIPPSVSTNTFLFGYQNSAGVLNDPGTYIYRIASTSNIISPLVGVTFGVGLNNTWWNICGGNTANPGLLKVTLPKFINYQNMVTGTTPTFVAGAQLDTLIWTVPDFSVAASWWTNAFCSFSAVVNATAVPNTTFNVTSMIFPTSDISLVNNVFDWNRTIDGPFDPNEKKTQAVGLQANGDVPFGTTDFYYTITFQNIGNAPAINVKTLDTIDVNFDLSALRVIQSSFPVSTQINNVNREVGFHFNGIYLPGAVVNEPGSHGFVKYGIKLNPGVPVNTVLKNRAHNYFDFNEPVATNQTSNKLFVLVNAINEYGKNETTVKAIPNPFNSNLKITSEKGIEKVKVFNLMGALMFETNVNAMETTINLESLPSAIYLVKVTSQNGATSTVRVIKN